MTFKLTHSDLDLAKEAIEFHGVDSFFPEQPELMMVFSNWEVVRDHISKIDLKNYKPYGHLTSYVLKNDKLVRPIDYLHIQDLIIFTAITLLFRDEIEAARLPKGKKKSFSYRAPNTRGVLYDTGNNYSQYRAATEKRLSLAKTKFVTIIDITDFFPRIYQHRLENALESFVSSERLKSANFVLAKKLLPVFSNKTSYGIPTGPFAGRVLAEAVLVDVDAMLADAGIDFVRWMDDFTVFSKTRDEGEQAIQLLTKWLHEHHGLSLNRAKTKIFEKADFRRDVWKTYDDEHELLRELVSKFNSDDPYFDDIEELDEDGDEEISDLELSQVFDLALTLETLPKYGLLRHITERVIFRDSVSDETRLAIIRKAIKNVAKLGPVVDSICKAIALEPLITDAEAKKFCKAQFSEFKSRKLFVPGHNVIWVCWLIGERDIGSLKAKVKELISLTDDQAVRKQAVLCLGKIGRRSDILAIKDSINTYSPSTRLSLIFASRVLGEDERGFWRRANTITDFYEKLAFSVD